MRKLLLMVVVLSLVATTCFAAKPVPTFKKLTLADQFYAEGAYYGDFNKDGRVDVTAALSTIPNDDFIAYFPLGLRAGYHFSESFAVEASFAYALQNPSDLTTFLKEDPQISLKEAEIQEKIDMFYNVAVLWAPIYGKVSVLGNKLTHFETYVGLGAGVFHTTTKDANNPDPQPEVKPAGNTVLGFRWFINDNFNLRTDYRHYFFQKFGGGVSIPAEFSLGLGFLI
jgi:outer membrane beta-barrel protein